MTRPPAPSDAPARDRAEVVEEKFTVPVIIAALASVPAMFLTMLDGTAETVGSVVNYASLAVLTAETAVLFVLAGDRVAWLKEHWWIAAIAVVSVPAVIFAVGPVQLLRLLRFVGALRIIRVNRIIKAGRILMERTGVQGPLRTGIAVGMIFLAAAFVFVILSDPTSDSREFLESTIDRYGPVSVLLAGLILGGATFVVVRNRGQRDEEASNDEPGGD